MFEGVPAEHFHQFIASPTPPSLPHPLSSFPLHGASTTTTTSTPAATATFPAFNLYPSHHPPPLHHSLHHHKHEEKGENTLLSTTLDPGRERSVAKPADPWSNDEVLALLRIRSSMDTNWFSADFTWENVSRKLAELGFKRTAEKCKEKYEEESRYFTTINYCKNLRFFSDLEELYHGDHQQQQQNQDPPEVSTENTQNPSSDETEKVVEKSKITKRKRGQDKRFEMLRSFCEDIVHKMLVQQELMHNKLLEDMMKRDEEMVAREEAWKKQEMDRVNKEIEIRAQEQTMAGDRQSIIIDLLNKFTSSSSTTSRVSTDQNPNPPTSVSLCETLESHKNPSSTLAQNISIVPTLGQASPNPKSQVIDQNPSSLKTQNNPLQYETPQNPNSLNTQKYPSPPTSSIQALAIENPNSLNTQKNPLQLSSTPHQPPQNPSLTPNDREDHGKRWPRDEVLSLINLRCSLSNNGDDKEGTKGPLWERISQGMLDLGYKRSAKRCKEKWENINKYFRKTKDVNRKRSIDSRTCPYFHQLSTLYSQGTLVAPSEPPENHSTSPENHPTTLPETLIGGGATMHATQGERNVVQAPPFDFEF